MKTAFLTMLGVGLGSVCIVALINGMVRIYRTRTPRKDWDNLMDDLYGQGSDNTSEISESEEGK